MLRGILSAVVVLSLGILVLLTLIFAQSAKEDLRSEAKTNLNAAKEVIRLANRMNDYSLVYAAEEVATKDSLSHALGCPKDAADVARRNRPEIDPQTGQPVEQDTEEDSGSDDGSGDRVCVDSQHELSLRVLKSWAQAQSSVWRENEIRFLSDRPLGAAIPRAPDLFIVADEDGEVVARQGFDMDQYYGPDRPNMNQFEVVGRTQEMGVQHDVIMWKDYADTPNAEMMQVAAAPVFEGGDEEGEFLGSVIIGYKINNQQATDLQDVLSGEDLLYFAATRSGEIGFAGNTLDRDPGFRSALNNQEFFEMKSDGSVADEAMTLTEVARTGAGALFYFEHDDETYYVMPATFAKERANSEAVAGFLVLSDIDRVILPVRQLTRYVPVAGIILAILTILLIFFIVKVFLQPIDEIGHGVQEVIAGNRDYMWNVDDSYFSDLAHSLNIMSARLQGKPDPDSEDAEGAREWQGMVGGGGGSQGGSGGANNSGGKKSIVGLGNLRGRSADSSDKKDE